MIKILSILVVVATLSQAAPRYGEDGGYVGYASYKPMNLNAILERLTGRSLRKAPAEKKPEPVSFGAKLPVAGPSGGGSSKAPEPALRPLKNTYSVPKEYDAIRYVPSYSYGPSNDLLSGSPTAPHRHSSLYGTKDGGYKLADTYTGDYSNSHEHEQDYPHLPSPYEYGYQIKDHLGNLQFKKEVSDGHGKVQGSYGFTDEHGLYREVQYVADKTGFRANVKTNEPGTKSEDPADVSVDSAESKI